MNATDTSIFLFNAFAETGICKDSPFWRRRAQTSSTPMDENSAQNLLNLQDKTAEVFAQNLLNLQDKTAEVFVHFQKAIDLSQSKIEKDALAQAQLSLIYLTETVKCAATFTTKVWLPPFLQESHTLIEQILYAKGAQQGVQLSDFGHDLTEHLIHLQVNEVANTGLGRAVLNWINDSHITSYTYMNKLRWYKSNRNSNPALRINPIYEVAIMSLKTPLTNLERLAGRTLSILEFADKILKETFPLPAEANEDVDEDVEIGLETEENESCVIRPNTENSFFFPERENLKLLQISPEAIQIEKRFSGKLHAALEQAILFSEALKEMVNYYRENPPSSQQECAWMMKNFSFHSGKAVEFGLHAVIDARDLTNQTFSKGHIVEEIFRRAFYNENTSHNTAFNQDVRNIDDTFRNEHNAVRYPLNKKRLYSRSHGLALFAAEAVLPIERESCPILEDLKKKEISPADLLHQQLDFTRYLFESYINPALDERLQAWYPSAPMVTVRYSAARPASTLAESSITPIPQRKRRTYESSRL